MNQIVEKSLEALENWAKEDSENRAVICITFEKHNETKHENSVEVKAEQQNLSFGQNGNLVLALTSALQENGAALARLVAIAVKTIQSNNFKTEEQ